MCLMKKHQLLNVNVKFFCELEIFERYFIEINLEKIITVLYLNSC